MLKRSAALAAMVSLPPPSRREGRAVIFPAPEGIAASEDWRLEVEGREVFCHGDYRLNTGFPPGLFKMKVSPQAYAIFDFEGAVTVRATLKSRLLDNLDGLKVRPLALAIKPRIAGNTVEFTLDRPGDVTLDPDGTGLCVLHLFTNRPETDIPRQDDPGVRYFGPGVHDVEALELKAGQTLYLAGGAVLRPCPARLRLPHKKRHYTGEAYYAATTAIQATGDNITIRGRGIVSGERGLPAGRRFGLFQGSRMKNLRMQGVVFTRATGWTLLMHDCRDSLLERVRVLGYFTNSDGICLHSCRDCTVTNCFIHTADDCYEVKSKGRGIVLEKSQVWCDAGTTMGVCHEIDGLVTDVTWRDMTVLHYTYRYNPYEGITSRGAIFIHPAMGGTVRNVRFENITVERCASMRPLIVVYNVKEPKESVHFFPDRPFSAIEGVVFEKIRASGVANPEILIMDQSGERRIQDIVFKDVIINDRPLTEKDPRLTTVGNVAGITVR